MNGAVALLSFGLGRAYPVLPIWTEGTVKRAEGMVVALHRLAPGPAAPQLVQAPRQQAGRQLSASLALDVLDVGQRQVSEAEEHCSAAGARQGGGRRERSAPSGLPGTGGVRDSVREGKQLLQTERCPACRIADCAACATASLAD